MLWRTSRLSDRRTSTSRIPVVFFASGEYVLGTGSRACAGGWSDILNARWMEWRRAGVGLCVTRHVDER